MDNWKIVNKIANGFGIVFIVFAIFTALINYELDTLETGTSTYPAALIPLSAVASMLVFLLFAVLSFVVARATMQFVKEEVPNETQTVMSEPKHETQTEEIEP
ncbi:MAG: hypothetical protein ABSA75_00790 [Candidatus Bathyarchaeia archaeon]|jgi:hypothetical protein